MKTIRKSRVLFLCTGNSCRSQMAEGWARMLHPDTIVAYSAGVETHGINKRAVKVMQEAGVDIAAQQSKHIDQLANIDFDWIVTVCDHAQESCPNIPSQTKKIHHSFGDPPKLAANETHEEGILSHYRNVRDDIKAFVEALPDKIS